MGHLQACTHTYIHTDFYMQTCINTVITTAHVHVCIHAQICTLFIYTSKWYFTLLIFTGSVFLHATNCRLPSEANESSPNSREGLIRAVFHALNRSASGHLTAAEMKPFAVKTGDLVG